MQSQVVATGIPFGEGPVWCDNGTLVVTSVAAGALYRVWPAEQRAEQFAVTGGGANGAAAAAGGAFVVTQNGGIDFSKLPLKLDLPSSPPPPARPGLQFVTARGRVSYLADVDLHGPNDLVVAARGTVYFTDPGHFPPPTEGFGRVLAYERDSTVRTVADGFSYCNGIVLEPDGTIVVVEGRGLQRVFPDGTREWVIETLGNGGGDGFCCDVDGRFYVASTIEHGIRVVDRDGAVLDFLPIEGDGLCTNCCFGGDDLRTLFVTDALPGSVVCFEAMPTPGLPLHVYTPPTP